MTKDMNRSREFGARLKAIVPGGAHTYAKGDDQYPMRSPGVLVRGNGCHVWDADGNEYIEYGMGLRSVGLGHAHPPVLEAVRAALELGNNFTRPALAELECAEQFLDTIPTADMVKFTKDGSTATTAALRLARRATGREMVAVCQEHPFFSYDDWFMATTSMSGGIPPSTRSLTTRFRYNDLESVAQMFATHPDQIAAVFLEPARTDPPADGFLEGLRHLCDTNGAVLVFDEMITGFRYALEGGQGLYGVTPDISTFGKAMANGFSLSALAGKEELMRLGSRATPQDDVFLLSTTHGAETPTLAAAMATMSIYRSEPVIEHLYGQGERLAMGLKEASRNHGLTEHVYPIGFDCNLVFATTGPDGLPSQEFRSLLLQETIARGVLMPSLVVSYSHSDDDIDRTIEALDGALGVYVRAMDAGTDSFLDGPPSRVVFDRRWV